MSYGSYTACVGLFLIATSAIAQDSADARVSWLKENAVPFSLQTEQSDDFADLEPLRERLSSMRCVALGEAQHGDGTTFRAKLRLVRFLHEKCGFDVIAWESGLWDCAQAWKAIRTGGDPRDSAAVGVFGVWTQSLQMADLWGYLAARAKADRPLELAGFDCQLTGSAGKTFAVDYAKRVAAVSNVEEALLRRELDSLVNALSKEGARPHDAKKLFARLDKALGRAKKSLERDFLQQCAESLRGALETRESRSATTPAERFNPRDRCMADNLRWLLERRHRGRKVIVWAATMHAVRRAEGLPNPAMRNYRGVKPVGAITAQWLGKRYFVVGFDCGGGETGFPWLPARRIAEPSEGSFASLARAAGLESAWIDVRDARGSNPFAKPIVARPLGHAEMLGRWPKHVDAMVFLDTMRRSLTWQDAAARELARDPVAAFAAAWASSRERLAAGNAYAEKGIPEQWDVWLAMFEPSRTARAEQQTKFEEWVAAQAEHPSLPWRVASFRASIAMSGGDTSEARKQLAVAVEAYPAKRVARPSVMSGFQHLVNRRALWLLQQDGVSAMIRSIVRPLAADPRFRYFFGKPYLRALDTAARARTRGALLRALAARAKRFPDDAASIAQQIAEIRTSW